MPTAYAENIAEMARDLINEGHTVDEVREMLSREVDETCDQIAYGDEDGE